VPGGAIETAHDALVDRHGLRVQEVGVIKQQLQARLVGAHRPPVRSLPFIVRKIDPIAAR